MTTWLITVRVSSDDTLDTVRDEIVSNLESCGAHAAIVDAIAEDDPIAEDRPRIRLADDGTLDTVCVCDGCGETFRFNYGDSHDDPDLGERCAHGTRGDEACTDCYDDFVAACLAEATDEHTCPDPRGKGDDDGVEYGDPRDGRDA